MKIAVLCVTDATRESGIWHYVVDDGGENEIMFTGNTAFSGSLKNKDLQGKFDIIYSEGCPWDSDLEKIIAENVKDNGYIILHKNTYRDILANMVTGKSASKLNIIWRTKEENDIARKILENVFRDFDLVKDNAFMKNRFAWWKKTVGGTPPGSIGRMWNRQIKLKKVKRKTPRTEPPPEVIEFLPISIPDSFDEGAVDAELMALDESGAFDGGRRHSRARRRRTKKRKKTRKRKRRKRRFSKRNRYKFV